MMVDNFGETLLLSLEWCGVLEIGVIGVSVYNGEK